jgi:hypothetical protein
MVYFHVEVSTIRTGTSSASKHLRQSDRAGRHPEQAIFEPDIKLFPAVHIYQHSEAPGWAQDLPDARKARAQAYFARGEKHRHVGRRAQGELVIR